MGNKILFLLGIGLGLVARAGGVVDTTAEMKVYPAPGNSTISNVEIYEPVAKVLFGSLKGKSELVTEDGLTFEVKKDQMISCSRKVQDGVGQTGFCITHMGLDGSLAPGAAEMLETPTKGAPSVRGIGEVVLSRSKKTATMRFSDQAAKALFLNMHALQSTQTIQQTDKGAAPIQETAKVGASLTCTERRISVKNETYECQTTMKLNPVNAHLARY